MGGRLTVIGSEPNKLNTIKLIPIEKYGQCHDVIVMLKGNVTTIIKGFTQITN